MALRDELLAEVGPKTHIAELCGRASGELLIKQMKIDQQRREIERLRAALSGMLEHVRKEQFCYCEFKDHTEPADEGGAVDAARLALSSKEELK